MNEKEQKDVNEILANIVGKPNVNGFRKGVTKKSILKSLTDDDWLHIDGVKAAEEVKANDYAYQFFLKSDQTYQTIESTKMKIAQSISEIKQINTLLIKNESDLLAGKTEQKTGSGEVCSLSDLEVNNVKLDIQCKRFLNLAILELHSLFKFVGSKGFDKKVMLTEEDFNYVVEDCVAKLKGTNYKLF